jgi:hypothetical protein
MDFDKVMQEFDNPVREGKVAVHRGIGGEYEFAE